jgi:glucan biosynthesis protein C
MLYGILVHSLTLGDFGSLEYIAEISNYFRMATFFFVSAFLAGMMFERIDTGVFIARRSIALIVPFLSALIVLNPVTLWLVYLYHGNQPGVGIAEAVLRTLSDPEGVAGPGVWHLHLWFLVSLYVYVLIAPLSLWIFRSHVVSEILRITVERLPNHLQPLTIALGTAVVVVALRTVQEVLAPWSADYWLIRATVYYLPYYLIGLLLFLNPDLWKRCHSIDPALIVLCLALYGLQRWGLGELTGITMSAFQLFFKAIVTTTAVFALLFVFQALLSQPGILLDMLSRSIYTIYLCHYFIIYLIAWLVKPVGLSGITLFLLVSLSSIAVGLGVHLVLVDRFGLLRFLFNGRFSRQKTLVATT